MALNSRSAASGLYLSTDVELAYKFCVRDGQGSYSCSRNAHDDGIGMGRSARTRPLRLHSSSHRRLPRPGVLVGFIGASIRHPR